MSGALATALDAACREFAGAVVADEEESFPLSDFSGLAGEVTQSLLEAGVQPDEPVAVLVSNRVRDLAAFLGVWRAGAVAAPIHRTTPGLALQGLLERLGARFVLDNRPHGRAESLMVYGIEAETKGCLHLLPLPPPAHRPLLEGAALIVFTSGTTGLPKGAVLGHDAFAGKLEAIDSLLHFNGETRTLLVLQITFSFGIWVSLLTLLRGGNLLMREQFTADALLPALKTHRATALALVPTMLRVFLAKLSGREPREALVDFTRGATLTQLLMGGENLGAELGRRLGSLFPSAEMVDIYGLTETATSDFFLMPADQPEHLGCIGRPSPGVSYRIEADGGGRVAQGEPGELQIRTPFIMSGYLDAPDLTQQAFADGYFRTGDIAREKAPGLVEMVGRAKEMISRGAAKIAPLEIEQVLCAHPAVAEALATGVPDEVLGERIHIFIVPRPGADAPEAELRAWAAERLEKFKRPDAFHFGQELPVGRTGKADRGALRKLLTGEA